jgi:hypothetical protein
MNKAEMRKRLTKGLEEFDYPDLLEAVQNRVKAIRVSLKPIREQMQSGRFEAPVTRAISEQLTHNNYLADKVIDEIAVEAADELYLGELEKFK